MAPMPDARRPLDPPRSPEKACHHVRTQPQGLLASGQNTGHAKRHDRPMAGVSRIVVCAGALDCCALSARQAEGRSVNRRVRTRMLGGVGRGS